jgi:hypothetical protein
LQQSGRKFWAKTLTPESNNFPKTKERTSNPTVECMELISKLIYEGKRDRRIITKKDLP